MNINNIDALTLEQRLRVEELVRELKLRKLKFPIIDYKPQAYQQEFIDAVKARNPDGTPKYKFIIFIGGNGAGKTQTGGYITNLVAQGDEINKTLGLPLVGGAPLIKIVTSTGAQIIENIEPYILGTGTEEDRVKIAGYLNETDKGPYVKKVRKDKEILKEIEMVNGTSIHFGSYDQGQARLQGGSQDFIWIDEVPTRWSDFRELIRGTRKTNSQFLMTFTPTNYNQEIYDWIFTKAENKFVRTVNAKENKFADHSWMNGLSEDELRIVESGEFIPPTGLVYKNFKKSENVIEHVHPRQLGRVKYYGAIDFGVKHPMAFLFIAVDEDGHIYIFDMVYQSGMLLKDLVDEVNEKKRLYGIDFEWIVADSAGSRERSELKALGMYTKKANKKKKEGTMSNRKGGIMHINQLLNEGKLIISDKCEPLIREFTSHHFSKRGEDGTVNKEDDDALDALRYFITTHLPSPFREAREKRKHSRRY